MNNQWMIAAAMGFAIGTSGVLPAQAAGAAEQSAALEGREEDDTLAFQWQTALKQIASQYNIDVENKARLDVVEEIETAVLKQAASQYNVTTAQKEPLDVIKDIQTIQLKQAADALNIEVKGKTQDDIVGEILDHHEIEAEAKGLFPFISYFAV